MSDRPTKRVPLSIKGMHCGSCEVLIERKFRKIPGVERVRVDHASGKADIVCTDEPDLAALNDAVRAHGYEVSFAGESSGTAAAPRVVGRKEHLETGAASLILLGLYVLFKEFDLLPKGLGVGEEMSIGLVFLIGVVAALSTCIAVTGGLVLAAAAKYNERNPGLTGRERFRPHLYFNAGRLASYAVLGGAVGSLGSVLTLSPRTTGLVTIVASVAMIVLGFQLLHLFPRLGRLQIKPPKFIAHRVHDLAGKDSKHAPFLLGAGTFFLPCGFTQALQLYVLSKGGFLTGASVMFVFALGTLPALLSLGALSSFAKGAFQRYFLKFAGVLVIFLGLFNVNNGLALAGSTISLPFFGRRAPERAEGVVAADGNVRIENGRQIVEMTVDGFEYVPNRFTVYEGVPVEWRIDGRFAEGCGRVIVMPTLGITEYLSPSKPSIVAFTPEGTGFIPFNCSMGMMTRGSGFDVVPNAAGIEGTAPAAPVPGPVACDPDIMNCIEPQRLSMEVSNERGFYPNVFTVKRGIPVELEIDAKVQLGGCMSTLVVPEYDVAHLVPLGKSVLRFTPTETGQALLTCSMGSVMGRFYVTD